MRNQNCCRWSGGLGTVLLLCVCGCVGPMFGGHGGQGGAPDGGFAAQWQAGGPRPGSKQLGQNVPAGFQQPAQPAATNDQMGLLTQKLQVTEDDRKVLAARLQQLEANLQEKEKILVLSNYEVQEAAKQVGQTREELRRWKQEMESLRGQLRNSEKENKGTLEAIIRTLEQFMDREKEVGRAAK
jgi:hypothetical protein